jgi:CelD/BcsL family acetyltransferase involved in cellulose biosynthesis
MAARSCISGHILREIEQKGRMAEGARESFVEERDAAPAGGGAARRRRRAAAQALEVRAYSDFDSLPEPVAAFLAAAGERSFFSSAAWFRVVVRTAGPPADRPRIYASERDGRVVAALVVRARERAGPLKSHVVTSPSHGLDAFVNGPILADANDGEAGVRAIVKAILGASPPVHVFRFECLDPQSRECRALVDALRGQRLRVETFSDPFLTFGETVEGLAIEQYLERRPPALRDYIERQVAAWEGTGRGRFEIVTGGTGFALALVDYALVDVQSWKDQEPYPDCLAQLLEAASRAGVLRLGLLYYDDRPVAAQIWIVSAGRATLWRSRFAKKFALHSVGAVVTFAAMRHILAADRPRELEFGPGDDSGRQQWLERRNTRIGVAVFNLRTAKGWGVAARHYGGDVAGAALRRVRSAVRRLLPRE